MLKLFPKEKHERKQKHQRNRFCNLWSKKQTINTTVRPSARLPDAGCSRRVKLHSSLLVAVVLMASQAHPCDQCGKDDGEDVVICEGIKISGDQCNKRLCLQCADFKQLPVDDWYCDSCDKRPRPDTTSTPVRPKQQKTVVMSPDLQSKFQSALKLPSISAFPGSGAASTSPSNSEYNVKQAFDIITTKLDSLDHKMTKMVTLDQFMMMKADIVNKFEATIAELSAKYDKVVKENLELKNKVAALGSRLDSYTRGPDVAFKRISFIGFPLQGETERVVFVKKWMEDNFKDVPCSVGNVFTGPAKNRKLTGISFVEFVDSDLRNTVLKQIESKSPQCTYSGSPIEIKPALSQLIRDRIWASRTAHDLIKAHPNAQGKTVERSKDKNSRGVKVNGKLVFDQTSPGGLGNFLDEFSDLKLPGKKA